MCLVKSDFVLENVKYFWIFFTFRFFEDKSDMMYHILNNREKKTSFLCGKEFYPFYLFLLSDWRNERETERRSPFFFRSSTFCERSPWCCFNRSVFFRTTERKWSREEELQVYDDPNSAMTFTNVSLPRFLLSFFPLRLILFLHITSLWSCSKLHD